MMPGCALILVSVCAGCVVGYALHDRKLPIFCPDGRRPQQITPPDRPRSPDRTRSPVAVSRKREYFKCPPETIGDFAPAATNFGARRPTANLQKHAIGGAL